VSEPAAAPLLPGREQDLLSEVIVELEATRAACFLLDADLTLRWVSPELQDFLGTSDPERLALGRHVLHVVTGPLWRNYTTAANSGAILDRLVPYALFHAEGTDAAIREELAKVATDRGLQPACPPAMWTGTIEFPQPGGGQIVTRYSTTLLGHPIAGWIGAAVVLSSPLRARVTDLLTRGDEALFERIAQLATPRQEPAAVLFADLEGSSALSRHLSTPGYFSLVGRLLTAVDGSVSRHLGIVGKHAGDGVTAFFRVTDAGSASGAVRSAIETAREISRFAAAMEVERPVRLNIGLHFAPALYLGQLITSGRLEVTALGDEVNECARVQESARNGTILATKLLVEQLRAADADALELRPATTTYTALGDWPTVTDKALRDAGGLPVTELNVSHGEAPGPTG